MPKKRKDGRYQKQITIGVRPDGTLIKKAVYGKTLKELDQNYREAMNLIERGIRLDADKVTVQELCSDWKRIKKEGKVTDRTLHVYNNLINHIVSRIGVLRVKDISLYTVESMVNDICATGHTSTAESVLSVMKQIMDYAISVDIIYKNPCKELSVKHVPNKRRALTDIEKRKIERTDLNIRDRAFISLLRYTGMRRNEILALEVSDIDLDNSLIYIHKTLVEDRSYKMTVSHSTKTDAGNRVMPILVPLKEPLQTYLESVGSGFLFLNRRGNLMNSQNVRDYMIKIRNVNGLSDDITPHSFRHTFISECYEAGVDVKRLQQWVGHSDISTTLNTYTHLDRQYVEDGTTMNDYYKIKSKKSKTSQIENIG